MFSHKKVELCEIWITSDLFCLLWKWRGWRDVETPHWGRKEGIVAHLSLLLKILLLLLLLLSPTLTMLIIQIYSTMDANIKNKKKQLDHLCGKKCQKSLLVNVGIAKNAMCTIRICVSSPFVILLRERGAHEFHSQFCWHWKLRNFAQKCRKTLRIADHSDLPPVEFQVATADISVRFSIKQKLTELQLQSLKFRPISILISLGRGPLSYNFIVQFF